MCGIVGVIDYSGDNSDSPTITDQMASSLHHRGPDGKGHFHNGPCSFAFRRLGIMDVEAPSPPFPNEDKTVWSMANAEIYNSDGIKSELVQKGHTFRTHVDTEVLPHLWEDHGPDLVKFLNGMFAFAIWDERQQSLMLGRDRGGEKPLYYWHCSKTFVFGSELRAMLAHPKVPRAIDPVALRRYLLHGYFPAPYSPIAEIKKLPAGHRLILKDGQIDICRYWDLSEYYQPSAKPRKADEIAEELDSRIAKAVSYRRRSDVPVGVFLSGGIDSSSILAHLSDQVGPGVEAFTLGHTDRSFDESQVAQRTAQHFDASFNELILSEADLADGLRMVGEGFDEPLGDASTIPTLLLSHFARKKVKVVLSGEGADEIFAGYPTYIGNKVVGAYQKIPSLLRRGLLKTVRAFTPVSMGNVGMDYLLQLFAAAADSELVERHQTWFGSISPDRHSSLLSDKMGQELEVDDPFASARSCVGRTKFPDSLSNLLYQDFSLYLQDDLLTKIDRSTMLASLEARAPFLDHELVEFAAGIPSSLKVAGITTKAILRKAVKKRLPKEVLQQRKRGFNIPFSRWLLNGLADEMRERFSREQVDARGLFSTDGIRKLLDEHTERKADHRKPLFALLAFDMWCDATYGKGIEIPVATKNNHEDETRKDSTDSCSDTFPVVPRSA